MSHGSRFDGREMAMVHRMFRREFLLAPGLVRRVAGGDTGLARTVAAHLDLISATLHHHHAGEDEHVWPLLQKRAPADLAGHLWCVEEQHRGIDTAQQRVAESLARWRGDADLDSRETLAAELDRLADLLVEHMDYEERTVVPMMESHISHDEWIRIAQSIAAGLDPRDAPLVLGMTMYEGEEDIIDRTISSLPPEVRATIRATAGDVYADHAELVHGSATPPRATAIRR